MLRNAPGAPPDLPEFSMSGEVQADGEPERVVIAVYSDFTVGLFQLGGCPPVLLGSGNERVNSKVWPIARGSGGTSIRSSREVPYRGLSPRGRVEPVVELDRRGG